MDSLNSKSNLLFRYCTGEELTAQERQDLKQWAAEKPAHEALLQRLSNSHTLQEDLKRWEEMQQDIEAGWMGFLRKLPESKANPPVRRIFGRKKWMAIAAAAIISLMAGGYLWITFKVDRPPLPAQLSDNKNAAKGTILTLSDGRKVNLDSLSNGVVARQQGIMVELDNGLLEYSEIANEMQEGKLIYHTISTPAGRQFKLTLPDGSMVWLNAATTLRYPVAFTGPDRRVEMDGEAFFEVKQNSHKPFILDISGRLQLNVLGTDFNVQSYANEPHISATLIEGKVAVQPLGASAESKGNANRMVELTPGQQALIPRGWKNGSPAALKITNVDKEMVLAWKNGFFNFQDMKLDGIMRELARWYDIEVEYQNGAPEAEFFGKISRNLSLRQVMNGFSAKDFQFKLEGKKLIIIRP